MVRNNLKEFLTYDEQITLLKERGLKIEDEIKANRVLKQISYYRFSAYSLTYRKDNVFYPNATFEKIYEIYQADQAFRVLIIKYTASIEIVFRNCIAHMHSQKYGSLGYKDKKNFDGNFDHQTFMETQTKSVNSSKECYISHHKNKYGGKLPLWVAIESMTFGAISHMFAGLNKDDRSNIASLNDPEACYKEQYDNVRSWLHCAVVARNLAAHQSRFYNRPLSVKPRIKKIHKSAFQSTNHFAFSYIYAIYFLLVDTNDKTALKNDIRSMLDKYEEIQIKYLGIPAKWESLLN